MAEKETSSATSPRPVEYDAQTLKWVRAQTYQSLAGSILNQTTQAASAEKALRTRADTLWLEISSRVTKNGGSAVVAASIADEAVGAEWEQRLEKARTGELDEVYNGALRAAIRCARSLLATSEHAMLMHKLQKKIG